MGELIGKIAALNWAGVISVAARLIGAAVLGGLIGMERGRHGRAAGLRTHMLVCIGAALTSLCGIYVVEELHYGADVSRLSAQVISGIGFLGAGMILIRNNSVVTGLTTAAGMWATAAIGIAMGFGFYSAALIAAGICLFSFTVLSRVESSRRKELHAYIELSAIQDTEGVIEQLRSLNDPLCAYDVIPPKSGHSEHVGIVCRISGEAEYTLLQERLRQSSHLAFMIREA